MREIAAAHLAESAHDLSDGGLGATLAECAVHVGAEVAFESAERSEVALFHEAPSRILLSTQHEQEIEGIAARHGVETLRLGVTINGRLRIEHGLVTLMDCELTSLQYELKL